jgi:Protein of unknown function (DUF4012)
VTDTIQPATENAGVVDAPAIVGWRSAPRRALHAVSRSRRRNLVAAALAFACVVLVGWAIYRAYTALDAYHQSLDDIVALESYSGRDLSGLDDSDVASIQAHLIHLNSQLQRIDSATALPFGSGVVERLPIVGPRYETGRALIRTGLYLSDAGITCSAVGQDMLDAFDATGASTSEGSTAPTWLDALLLHEPEIRTAMDDMSRAKAARADVDDSYLPAGARTRMAKLDRVLDRFDYGNMVDEYYPLARSALGADQTVRYLVLFQNPAELRPSGGFPGTMGVVSFERGQLGEYTIFDAHELSDQYISQQHPPRSQPWPIQQYFPSPSLVLHDATWWADFPRSGQTILDMYQETGNPPIQGVVAVQPSVISDLLRITGPFTVEVDGEERTITADNVYDEIERQRRLHREGVTTDEHHKELLEIIGTQMLQWFQTADRGSFVQAVRVMRSAADRRDVQMFSTDAHTQAWLDERHWSGKLVPDPAQPTLAIVLANVVTNKASMRLDPTVDVELGAVHDGMRDVTLNIHLLNTGTNDEDPFYAGFAKWWVELTLPQGSTRTATQPDPLPDPDSPDGGSYMIAVFPQETGFLSVSFTMPDDPSLFLRREPGAVPLKMSFTDTSCGQSTSVTLTTDTMVPLDALCR